MTLGALQAVNGGTQPWVCSTAQREANNSLQNVDKGAFLENKGTAQQLKKPEQMSQLFQSGNQQNGKSAAGESEASCSINK